MQWVYAPNLLDTPKIFSQISTHFNLLPPPNYQCQVDLRPSYILDPPQESLGSFRLSDLSKLNRMQDHLILISESALWIIELLLPLPDHFLRGLQTRVIKLWLSNLITVNICTWFWIHDRKNMHCCIVVHLWKKFVLFLLLIGRSKENHVQFIELATIKVKIIDISIEVQKSPNLSFLLSMWETHLSIISVRTFKNTLFFWSLSLSIVKGDAKPFQD